MLKIKNSTIANSIRLLPIKRHLKAINQLADRMSSLSDEELQAKTKEFKKRLSDGETLDDILVEAFAVAREADKRVLGMFPYDVQVMGGLVLHQGDIAEMKTGEGKTLTATMPVYLNALTGDGVMVITTNDYLSRRDFEEIGPVFRWLGLTVSVGVPENPTKKFTVPEKKAIYRSDIVYTTNYTIGFDYLIENLADSKKKQFLRPFNFAIIDEVDSILLDSAQTPLIISGAPRVQSNYYEITNEFVQTLQEGVEFEFDDERENVWLTSKGIEEAERFFGIPKLFNENNSHDQLIRHIVLALKAHNLFKLEEEYVVDGGEVVLLDSKSGRALVGTKLQAGQHQAIETKEHVKLTPETRSMASVTYQNLFRLFKKIGGMTGTGMVASEEFAETYNMLVIAIPTNRGIRRVDKPDKVYTSLPEKLVASMEYVKKIHRTGQPILLVTASVEMSEIYSHLLLREGIPHSTLNAYNTAKEAMIVAEAGQMGNVTVVTPIAGRGTDIKLGPGVAELGGLAVIGTERMPSKRIDQQMRGRSGRQGDPGMSQFFVSLEDPLLVKWGPSWLFKYLEKKLPEIDPTSPKELRSLRFTRLMEVAQQSSDTFGQQTRQHSLELDESLQKQRQMVYQKRNDLIQQNQLEDLDVLGILDSVMDELLSNESQLTTEQVNRFVYDNLSYNFNGFSDLDLTDSLAVREALKSIFLEEVSVKERAFYEKNDYIGFQRMAILKAIDEAWIEQVDYLQQFRVLVSSRQSAQRNTTYEFHREAFESYKTMQKTIKKNIIKNLALSMLVYNKDNELVAYFP
ncbi:accessory Sec system translocase SecA2 [Streptococcus suis]|nr:accessory Sec system translocase SecA2 [Streptococcus suis]NQP36932.1 accessory Sec system translocase SecA2 [Streptococcus suis]